MKILSFLTTILLSLSSYAQLQLSPAPTSGQIALTQTNTYIYITNPSSVVVSPNITLGSNSAGVTLSSSRCATLKAKSTCYIIVNFPTYSTNSQALNIPLSSGATVLANLTFAPVVQPSSSIFTTSSLIMDGFSNYSFTVQNKTSSAKSYAPVISGTDAAKYSIVLNRCSNIVPNGTCLVYLKLAPQEAGSYSASVTEPQVTGSLSLSSTISGSTPGVILPPNPSITMTPASQSFGTITNLGKTAAKSFTITNNGNVAVSPIVSVAGSGLEISLNRCLVLLSPNQSCSVSVLFNAVNSMTNGAQSGLEILAQATSSTSVLTSTLDAILSVNPVLLSSSNGSVGTATEIKWYAYAGSPTGLNMEPISSLSVDWGDGIIETISSTSQIYHEYLNDGEYTVKITGPWIFSSPNSSSISTDKNILEFKFGPAVLSSDLRGFFSGESSSILISGNPNFSPNTDLSYMFAYMNGFNQDLNSWNTSNVINMESMFRGASSFNGNITSWNTANVTNMSSMFRGANVFNQNIGSWNTSSVTDMNYMFFYAYAFNGNIGLWNTSIVTDMSTMFYACYNFNQDLGNWNTSNVTNMANMFVSTPFNHDIGDWDTSQVTNMASMFSGTTSFNQDIGGWDTSQVTNMTSMFSYASAFNKNLNSWNTSKVEDMTGMFRYSTSFNGNIGSWNTSGVYSMSSMFNGASSFNQDLSGWCVLNIPIEPSLFSLDSLLSAPNTPVWGTCPVP